MIKFMEVGDTILDMHNVKHLREGKTYKAQHGGYITVDKLITVSAGGGSKIIQNAIGKHTTYTNKFLVVVDEQPTNRPTDNQFTAMYSYDNSELGIATITYSLGAGA
jgi:hypothetical protein